MHINNIYSYFAFENNKKYLIQSIPKALNQRSLQYQDLKTKNKKRKKISSNDFYKN